MKPAIGDKQRAVFCVLGAILIALLCAPVVAQEITVAAASDLQFAMREIAQNYEHKTGNHVKLTFGSSGALAAQIQNGAPFDAFFSADVKYPEMLVKNGAADGKTLVRYARGILVVWVSAGGVQGPLQLWIQPLRSESVEKIAIANPAHAPYGRAAVEALRKADLYERVAGKLVTGENVSQAAQFAESGNAQVALLPLSLASVAALKEKGRYIRVPENLYAPIVQAAVVTKQARNATAAQGFLRFVVHEGIVTLRKYGFEAQELNPPPVVQP